MRADGPPITACYDDKTDKWIPGCPFWHGKDEGYCILCVYGDLDFDPFNCRITPADFPIIKAMLAGEWSCETCRFESGNCEISLSRLARPCAEWQPKESHET